MSGDATKSAKERIQELEAERAKRREQHAAAREEQVVLDLEALAALETGEDFDRVLRVDLRVWKPGVGAATMIIARVPSRGESIMKRYEQTIAKAKPGTTQALDASQALAESCLVYPSKKDHPEMYRATMDLSPGIETNLAVQIVQALQGVAEAEKKD